MPNEIELVFTELFFGAGSILGVLLFLSIILLVSRVVRYSSILFYPILIFLGLEYLENLDAGSRFLWNTIIVWSAIPLLIFIESKNKGG